MPKRLPDDVPWARTGKTVGEGGQGRVHEVEPRDSSQFSPGLYGMKELRKVSSNQAKTRFHTEVEAIKRLEDPRVVRIIDHSSPESSFLYYVMPLYTARTLSDLVFSDDSPFRANARACLEFIADCAEALHICHEKRVIHRDIKPDNILVDANSLSPIILDFGCCQIDNGHLVTLTDEGVGTPNYMAPECEAGGSGPIAAPTDVYSLGKILWTMVTGQHAFARENPAFTSKNIEQILPHNKDCCHLNVVFENSIRKDVAKRYSSCERMAWDCRTLANEYVGRFPPLEEVSSRCPACGYPSSCDIRPEHQVRLHMIFKKPMPTDCFARQCGVCGYLYLWNGAVLRDRKRRFETLD